MVKSFCEVCGKHYNSTFEAQLCEDNHNEPNPPVKTGDVITTKCITGELALVTMAYLDVKDGETYMMLFAVNDIVNRSTFLNVSLESPLLRYRIVDDKKEIIRAYKTFKEKIGILASALSDELHQKYTEYCGE